MSLFYISGGIVRSAATFRQDELVARCSWRLLRMATMGPLQVSLHFHEIISATKEAFAAKTPYSFPPTEQSASTLATMESTSPPTPNRHSTRVP